MLENIIGLETILRVVTKHSEKGTHYQIIIRQVLRNDGRQNVFLPVGKRQLMIGQWGQAWPIGKGGCAKNSETKTNLLAKIKNFNQRHSPKDTENLINLRIAMEERFFGQHFIENAGHAPNIHACWVFVGTQQNFGSTIPKGHDFVSVSAERNTKSTSQTKISYFESASTAHKQILRLQIAMNDSAAMTKL